MMLCPSCKTAQDCFFACFQGYTMVKAKRIREKGKIKLSGYFKTLQTGDRVSVIVEKSVSHSFPDRLQGRSGVVSGTRGSYKEIKLSDGNKEKLYLIHPVHLRKV